jgi:hypothetical protein
LSALIPVVAAISLSALFPALLEGIYMHQSALANHFYPATPKLFVTLTQISQGKIYQA